MSVSMENIWTIERYLIIISKLLFVSILDEFYLDDKYKCNKYLNTFYKYVIYILYFNYKYQILVQILLQMNCSIEFIKILLLYNIIEN